MALTTFADTLTVRPLAPARQQVLSGPMAGVLHGPESVWDNRAMVQAAEQAKHFRLWNYLAIDANSTKAGSYFPAVSVARKAGTAAGPRDQAQRRHLRAFYQNLYGPDEELEPAPAGHPLVDLLHRVNSTDWWGSFAYETFMFLQLQGQFCWWVIPNAFGLPAELWSVPPQWVKPVYDQQTGELRHWLVTPYGDKRREKKLPPNEIIRACKKNPLSPADPTSPVQAGAEWVLNSEDLERARHLTYRNGPLQTAVLELNPEYHENPDEKLLDYVGEKFLAKYGGKEKSFKPITMPPGLTLKPWSLKPSEMVLGEMSDQLRDQVLALHGTPKAAVGLAHDLNKASIYGAELIWCRHRIMPLHAFVAGVMTEKLASRFDQSLRVWFEDCEPWDEEADQARWKMDLEYGAASPDDLATHRGREPLGTEWSEKRYIKAGLVPLDEPEEPSGEQPAKPDDAGGDVPDDAGEDDTEGAGAEDEAQRVRQPAVRQATRRERRILRAFVALHSAIERAAHGDLRRFWGAARRTVMTRWDAGEQRVESLLRSEEFQSGFNRAMRPHWEAGAGAGVVFEADALGIELETQRVRQEADPYPDIRLELPPEMKKRIAAFLKERQEGIWQKVLPAVHRELRKAIQKGLENGEDIRTIGKRIASVMDQTRKQSVTTARTEATASLNYGQQGLREQHGIAKKIWLSTIDDKTRPTHVAAHDQIVPNQQSFMVGGYMMAHPGDGSQGAPAEEIVSCRCCATGYVE